MDLIAELGALALGSRMKRLSNELLKDVDNIYKYAGVDFQSQWFTTFTLSSGKESPQLQRSRNLFLSRMLQLIKYAKHFLKKSLLKKRKIPKDERRRLVKLSGKGLKLAKELEPTWKAIQDAVSEVILESKFDILGAILKFEDSIVEKRVSERAIQK